ncbi:MAG: VanW family protein [Eubacterium sp.]|nr:VanW family protein [Eubacterium sp.]
MKKLISILLAAAMLFSVTCGMNLSAFADDCAHANTHLVNDKAATATEPGYTGDVVCDDCGEVIETGEEIPVILTGWQTDAAGNRYYYNESGTAVKYWQQIDGKWYYFRGDTTLYLGWLKASGKWYYMGTDGAMKTGWQKIGGKYYYFDSQGVMQTGWKKLNGKWYYLNSSGAMLTGWQKINNKWYYMNGSGVMLTGWRYIGKKWYYFNTSGAMQTKWLKQDGKWYFLGSDGAMRTGWFKDGSSWYYANKSGVMQTGWIKLGGSWYYLETSGKMATGWKQIDGKSYYFNASGVWTSGFVNVYASYTSKYSNNANRTTNLRVSSAAINGTILNPGDTFDFNSVVGWRTAARGYKEAPVFLGPTEHGLGLGGGVCQTSSTVFNAALLANLEIVERHQHSQKVTYVPYGRDAAISGSEKNMRFKNTSPYTIKIEMTVEGGYITCKLLTVEHVSPPSISIDVSKSGSTYTMRRYVNGSCNYTTKSTY